MNVSVRVGEYVWSAHSPPIRLKRHDNIPQQAPLENTVMQIASSVTFPAVNKEGSPKVSTFQRQKHQHIIEPNTFELPTPLKNMMQVFSI